jgi:predicted GH43/DUF377 family glycosyl hydrolase
METALSAVALLASLSLTAALFGLLLAVCVGFLAIILYWFFVLWGPHKEKIALARHSGNPVLGPEPSSWWESEAVFNPGAFVDEGMVHLFYRALGRDGVSRIGHATSVDGVHFTRSNAPIYDWGPGFALQKNRQYPKLSYNTDTYASGGGWGGCEDPRAVLMKEDGAVYMTFGVFEGWQSIRMAVTSLGIPHLRDKRWWWSAHIPMSPKGETHKNWVLFPEKINGKYAILHALTPVVLVDYLDSIEDLHDNPIQSNNQRSGREGQWDAFVRGAGAG